MELLAEYWSELGILAVFVILMVTGQLVPGFVYRREAERVDRLEKDNTELRDKTEERVLPLVFRAIDALERSHNGGSRSHSTKRSD